MDSRDVKEVARTVLGDRLDVGVMGGGEAGKMPNLGTGCVGRWCCLCLRW